LPLTNFAIADGYFIYVNVTRSGGAGEVDLTLLTAAIVPFGDNVLVLGRRLSSKLWLDNLVLDTGQIGSLNLFTTDDKFLHFNCVVTNTNVYGNRYATTQEAITACPDGGWILIEKEEVLTSTLTCGTKRLNFMFKGITTGWTKGGATVTAITTGKYGSQFVGLGQINGFNTGINLGAFNANRIEMYFSGCTVPIASASGVAALWNQYDAHGSLGLDIVAAQTGASHGDTLRWDNTNKRYVATSALNLDDSGVPTMLGIVPVGAVLATMPHLAGAYACSATTVADTKGFVLCAGQVINDLTSPLNGRTIPNINNDVFLAGNSTSGTSGGANTKDISHTHSVTSNVTVANHAAHTHSVTSNVTVANHAAHTHTVTSNVTVAAHNTHQHQYTVAVGVGDHATHAHQTTLAITVSDHTTHAHDTTVSLTADDHPDHKHSTHIPALTNDTYAAHSHGMAHSHAMYSFVSGTGLNCFVNTMSPTTAAPGTTNAFMSYSATGGGAVSNALYCSQANCTLYSSGANSAAGSVMTTTGTGGGHSHVISGGDVDVLSGYTNPALSTVHSMSINGSAAGKYPSATITSTSGGPTSHAVGGNGAITSTYGGPTSHSVTGNGTNWSGVPSEALTHAMTNGTVTSNNESATLTHTVTNNAVTSGNESATLTHSVTNNAVTSATGGASSFDVRPSYITARYIMRIK
jgi:hypothetical protein